MGFVDQDVEVGTAEAPLGIPWRVPTVPLGVVLGGAGVLVLLSLPAVRRRPKTAAAGLTLAAVVTAVGVARSQGGGPAFYWIHTDHLGTPLAVTDTPATASQATAVWRAAYTPFGEATVDEDPDGDLALVSLSLRFLGQLHDPEVGLHYNYFRVYEPRGGRYLVADPIGQRSGINQYAFVGSNPLRWVDPLGLEVLNPQNFPLQPHVRQALEDFNDHIGRDKDIVVTGGDRRPSSRLGARAASQHVLRNAADISVPGQRHLMTANQAKNSGLFSAVGWYEEGYRGAAGEGPHVHVDLRPRPPGDDRVREWGYDWTGREHARIPPPDPTGDICQ
jgi:RHS repeat-associated protein